jgi:hypothetical protein
MKVVKFAAVLLVLLVLVAIPASSQWKRSKDKQDPNTRSVQGFVLDEREKPAKMAVVQLKNAKTLQVRSYITQEDGRYQFQGLSTNIDYELQAEHGGLASAVRRLSVFDTRLKAELNLKLEPKKK